jgi:hypothetical protein
MQIDCQIELEVSSEITVSVCTSKLATSQTWSDIYLRSFFYVESLATSRSLLSYISIVCYPNVAAA